MLRPSSLGVEGEAGGSEALRLFLGIQSRPGDLPAVDNEGWVVWIAGRIFVIMQ